MHSLLKIVELGADHVGPLFNKSLELYRRLVAEVDRDLDPYTEAGLRSKLRGTETFAKHTVVAVDRGVPVGMARMWIHNIEGTTERAETMIEVDPSHRRQGIGTALLRSVLDTCEREHRTSLTGMGVNGEANNTFWTSYDAKLGLVERESRLWMAQTNPELMDQWMTAPSQRAVGYRLVHWRGQTPPAMLDPMATLLTAMNDAPTDDLDWEDDIWTAQNVADLDGYYDAAEVERQVSVVLAPDGSPAGLTEMATSDHQPRFGSQGNTVVIDAHRNRGIGRWLKADMWLRLRSDHPRVEAIDTDNAASNDAMLSINVAMGFAPRVEQGLWQANLDTFRQHLPPTTN